MIYMQNTAPSNLEQLRLRSIDSDSIIRFALKYLLSLQWLMHASVWRSDSNLGVGESIPECS